MRRYLILALLGLALATQPDSFDPSGIPGWDEFIPTEREIYTQRNIQDTVFQSGKEYRFFYDGQIMNGIPRSSRQHSATRMQALVVLQMKAQDTMMLKIEKVRMGKLNRKVFNPRHPLPFRNFNPVTMDPYFKEQLEKPIKFQYTDGMITNIYQAPDDCPISMNVKRGILNLLQLNLQEKGSTESTDHQLTNAVAPQVGRSKFFRVMEKTLEGECETLYAITRLPRRINQIFNKPDSSEEEYQTNQPRLNVTRTINFERCKNRPIVKYNFRNSAQCKTCDPKFQDNSKYLKSSSVMKYNVLGTRRNFLIQSVFAESQHSVEFYSEAGSFINVYITQRLDLYKTGPISTPIQPQPSELAETALVYSRQWDVLNEEFQLNSHQGHPRKLRNKPQNFVEQVTELLKKMAETVTSNPEQPIPIQSLNKYQLLVAALRKAVPQDLEQLHETVYNNPTSLSLTKHQQKLIQDILEPAVASAGTEACVQHLVKKIQANKLRRSLAVSALRQLPNARVVSKKTVNHIKSLCTENVVLNHVQLKRSCYLTLGSLVKAACNSKPDVLAVDHQGSPSARCTQAEKKTYLQFFVNKMKSATKWENKVLYLKALGNAALDISVFELEKIIHNTEQFYPIFVRSEAIVALRQLTGQMPQKIQKILMPIYMNPREPAVLRQLSAILTLITQPERPLLDMMAKQIDREPIRQVAMFTYQAMTSFANTSNPCWQQMAANLKLALRLTRQVNPGPLDSKVTSLSLHSWMRKIGLDLSLFELVANNSIIPKTLGGTLHTTTLGYLNPELFTAVLNTEGLEQLIPRLWQQDGTWNLNMRSRHARDTRNYKQQIENIFQKLSITSRHLPITPKVYGYWRFHGQETGFLPINKELIDWLYNNVLSGQDFETMMRSGEMTHVNWHHAVMLEDAEAKFPTLLGFPLVLKHKVPVFMRVEGTLKSEIDAMNPMKLISHLKPSIIMKAEHTAEVWSPSAPVGARVRSLVRAQLPFSGKLEYNSQTKNVKITMQTPTTDKELLRLETQPITFTRPHNSQVNVYKVANELIVRSEEINRVQKINRWYHPMGLKFHVLSRYTPAIPEPQGNWVPMCPLSGPNYLSIRTSPPADNTKKIVLNIEPEGSLNLEQPLSSVLLNSLQPESESMSQSSEEIETNRFTSPRQRYGKIVAELMTEGSSTPRHYKLNLRAAYSLKGQAAQLKAKVSRISPNPYQICLNSEILYPSTPFTRQSLERKKIVKQTELRWGPTCQGNNFVEISATAERTRKQRWYEQQSMTEYHECKSQEKESPIACYPYLAQAGFLNKYNLIIKYNNVPVIVQNVTNKIYQAIKTYYYPNTDIADIHVRNPANRIRATLRIDPQDRRRVNMTVKTPRQNVTMTDIWVPISVPRLNVKRSLLSSALSHMSYQPGYNTYQHRPTCKVYSNYISTFDGRSYRAPLTKCYSIVAKDCSEDRRFVVLMKRPNPSSNKKVVKIITPSNEIKMKKSGSEFEITRNGEVITLEPQSSEYNMGSEICQRTGPYVVCNLPEVSLKVYYDGVSTHIKVTSLYVGRLCGLCGHMNNDPSDDFQTPEFQPQSDLRQFQRSYIFQNEDCEENSLPELNDICPNERCSYQSSYEQTESEESSMEVPYQHRQHYKQSWQPQQLNRMMQKMGKPCFSKEPIPTCPDYAHPKEAQQQEVEYTCLDEFDQRAQEWMYEVQTTPIPELKNLPTSFQRTEIVPTSCKQEQPLPQYYENY